ncbi:CBS domain-containing protein [Nocardioides panacisoli]|uniref:putative nucleotidyltransferase substrate binding domain-containing protein n=1 Tax=Nocardioides panacisoli TaxID=627624 RepID=UPI001C629476|nr:putative nucleotidyltransferase substrate binding domain-containing protein [Nocardioides panacisoli]QYJ03380.1 CBS domain-containing protein [Nocardioides panacisoli]
MTAELDEVRRFLADHPPFDRLPEDDLTRLPRRLEVAYFRRGTVLRDVGEANDDLFVVRSGGIDVHDGDRLVARRGVGEAAGISTLTLEGLEGRMGLRLTAYEDTLALVMPGEVFRDLAERHPTFRLHYVEHEAARLQHALTTVQQPRTGGVVLRTRVGDLVRRAPVAVGPDASVREAAAHMRDEGVSSVLITRDGALLGILTDRDLRTRVVAADRSPDDAVTTVMSAEPFTVESSSLAFELMLEMTGRTIHHAPVLERGRVIGVVTSTDLLRLERTNPIYLVGDIGKQDSVAALAEASRMTPRVVESLVDQDATADDIGRMVSAIGDAIERRLLSLLVGDLERDLGPAPTAYCWVALGSRARLEQGLASDQDHGLVLGGPVEGEAATWFERLTTGMVDGLAACGYPPCLGDKMASNPRWRQPVAGWTDHVDRWLRRPTPEAILDASVFFDMRPVAGDPSLHAAVADHVRTRAPEADIFLLHLAGLAVRPPPLGFFRGFVLEKDGKHRDTLDLKKGGVHAVVGIGRLHALAHGLPAVNTHERLAAAADAGAMSAGDVADLRDAFEFLSYVRLRHHAQQVRAGAEPDNFVAPGELSGFDRRTLRDAFEVVRRAQRGVEMRYPVRNVT